MRALSRNLEVLARRVELRWFSSIICFLVPKLIGTRYVDPTLAGEKGGVEKEREKEGGKCRLTYVAVFFHYPEGTC